MCLPELFWKVCFGKLFPSTETNFKQTSFWTDFAQMTSHQFVLRFRLRYMGAFSNSPVHGSMRTVIKPSNICVALQYLPSRLSNTFSWQCVIAHTKWWNGKILNMFYWRWVYNRWPPDLLWAANHWTVLGWPHTYCRPLRTHGICPPWHPSPGCYHSQHAGKTHRQGVSVQGNTVEAFSDRDYLIQRKTCHSHSCIESEYDMKRWMVLVLLQDRDFTLDINTVTKLFTALFKIK